MTSNSENRKLTVAWQKTAVKLTDELMIHDVKLYQLMLKKLLYGWISTPLDLEPEERINTIIMVEDLESFFVDLQKLQREKDIEHVKSIS